MSVTIAAVADIHVGTDTRGLLAGDWANLDERADMLVVAGDLTKHGDVTEAEIFCEEATGVAIPIVVVLGNHDYHGGNEHKIREVLEAAGMVVLEGEHTTIDANGTRVAVVGSKGFGGGFAGASATHFGEPEMKAFVEHAEDTARRFEEALRSASGDVVVCALHYSPVPDTLAGERLEIYPFLGSYLFAEAIDAHGADAVFHGHAHSGTHQGATAGGVPVYNVSVPVVGSTYKLFEIGDQTLEPGRR